MEKGTKRTARSYSKEYKVEAVKLAREIGGKKAAAELGIPDGTMSSWMYDARKGAIDTGKGTQTPESGLTQAVGIRMKKSPPFP